MTTEKTTEKEKTPRKNFGVIKVASVQENKDGQPQYTQLDTPDFSTTREGESWLRQAKDLPDGTYAIIRAVKSYQIKRTIQEVVEEVEEQAPQTSQEAQTSIFDGPDAIETTAAA